MKKPATKQFIKELTTIRRKFQQYCHKTGCEALEVCPEAHDCIKHLDLNTAISWEIANDIKHIINCLVKIENLNNPESIEPHVMVLINLVKDKCIRFDVCNTIIGYHYQKYPKLWELTWNLRTKLTKHMEQRFNVRISWRKFINVR